MFSFGAISKLYQRCADLLQWRKSVSLSHWLAERGYIAFCENVIRTQCGLEQSGCVEELDVLRNGTKSIPDVARQSQKFVMGIFLV